MARIDVKNAVLTVSGLATTDYIEVKIGEGNFTWTETKNREYLLERGSLTGDTVRDGDEAPMEVSFQFVWEYITGGPSTTGDPSVEDALKNKGSASGWDSSDTDACQPYAVNLELTYTPSCTTGDVETILFPDFRYEQLQHDLRAGQISCSGKCNVTEPTITREAQV